MQIIKLHEATKQFKIPNKLAMFFLEKRNVPVKSHSSVITMEQLIKLREFAENQDKFKDIIAEFDRWEASKKHLVKSPKDKLKGEEGYEEEATGGDTSTATAESLAGMKPEGVETPSGPPPSVAVKVESEPERMVHTLPEPVETEAPQTMLRMNDSHGAPLRVELHKAESPRITPSASEAPKTEEPEQLKSETPVPERRLPEPPRAERRPDYRPPEQRGDQPRPERRPDNRPPEQRGDQPRPERRPDSRPPEQRGDQPRPERRPDSRPPEQRGDQPRPERRPDNRPPEQRGDQPRPERRPDNRPPEQRGDQPRPERRPDNRPPEQRGDQPRPERRPDNRPPEQRGDQPRPERRPDNRPYEQRSDQPRPERRPDNRPYEQRSEQPRPERRPDNRPYEQRGDQPRPERRPDNRPYEQRGDQPRPERRPDNRPPQQRTDQPRSDQPRSEYPRRPDNRRLDQRGDQPRPEGQRPRPEGARPPYPRDDRNGAPRPPRPDQRPDFKRPRPDDKTRPRPDHIRTDRPAPLEAEKPRRMDPTRKVQIDAAKKEREFVAKRPGDFEEKAGKKVKKVAATKATKWKIEPDHLETAEETLVEAPVVPVKKAKKEWGDRRSSKESQSQPQAPAPRPKPKVRVYHLPELIQIPNFITLKELTEKLNLKLRDIEDRKGDLIKQMATNQLLEEEHIRAICQEFKVEADIVPYEDFLHYEYIAKYKAELTTRAPVVTVMGHVDHGKTTLLDTLRNTRVADREAGGITQKIGAYRITLKGNEIVFVDTPGHEAFTNIRARGAKVTDIVILVVAANDGVQPQTVEAINHARAADVPIIVAINKIDLPGADASRVKQNLTKHNLIVEDWGGEVVSVEISAKHNQNLDTLLEMVTLVAEMLEIKAYDKIPARGIIIESRLDPKLGPMGTVLLQHGAMKHGDCFICGNAIGKIKAIFNDRGEAIKTAQAPMPVEIMGFDQVPEAGELFQVTDDVDKARKVIEMRKIQFKTARNVEAQAEKKLSLQNLFEKLEESKSKVFNIIIKTDNFSSCEVLESILMKQDTGKVKINIVHKSIGNITESDILLASTSNSIIFGFNVRAPQKILLLAKREQIEVRLYNVIYHLIEEVEKALRGEIEPEYIETRIGRIEVLQTFKISHVGLIAGCIVREGKVTNKSKLKVLRGDDLVFEGELETLRRVKNEASEVNAGTECGVKIKNFNSIEIGDILEAYELKLK